MRTSQVQLGKLFGFPQLEHGVDAGPMLDKTAIGLEIELENIQHGFGEHVPYWSIEGDGSLKYAGAEFVFKKPLRGSKIVKALLHLKKFFNQQGLEPDASCRTSVHTHVDCTDLNTHQVGLFALALVCFEPILFKMASTLREDNPYCVPIGGGIRHNDAINNLIKNQGYPAERDNIRNHLGRCLRKIAEIDGRYSSINLMSLLKFGTIEIRILQGTYDKQEIVEWLNLLLAIKAWSVSSLKEEHLQELFDNFSGVDVEAWLKATLGEKVYQTISHINNKDALLLEGIRAAQDTLYHNAPFPEFDVEDEGQESLLDSLVREGKLSAGRGGMDARKWAIPDHVINDILGADAPRRGAQAPAAADGQVRNELLFKIR